MSQSCAGGSEGLSRAWMITITGVVPHWSHITRIRAADARAGSSRDVTTGDCGLETGGVRTNRPRICPRLGSRSQQGHRRLGRAEQSKAEHRQSFGVPRYDRPFPVSSIASRGHARASPSTDIASFISKQSNMGPLSWSTKDLLPYPSTTHQTARHTI
jgi:hypothetical protein